MSDEPLTLQNKLEQRGIAATATTAGWQLYSLHGRPGCRYPVHFDSGTAQRWKAFDGQKPKYAWLPSKPAGCKYYMPQGIAALREAIANDGGILHVANGEPALLAYLSAGIQNVVCWFGEGQPPRSLAADLRQWGVQTLRYPADKDAAGTKSALKVRDALKDSDIAFYPLQWGDNVPDKGDANDLWIAVDFDTERFLDELHQLAALILPAEDPQPNLVDGRTRPTVSTLKRDDAIAEVIRLAQGRAGAQGRTKTNGDWLNFCCLLHDEHEPSAGINTKTGAYSCFVCGSLKLHEVCERLGIDYVPWTPQQPPAGKGNNLLPEVTSLTGSIDYANPNLLANLPKGDVFDPFIGCGAVFTNDLQPNSVECLSDIREHKKGVPDSWRSTLLRYAQPAALLYELLYTAIAGGHLDPDQITRPALLQANIAMGWGLTAATIYRGFDLLAELFFAKCPTDNLDDSVGQSAKKGRQADFFSLLPLSQQQQNLLRLAAPAIVQRRHPVEAKPNRAPVVAQISARALVDVLAIDESEAAALSAELDHVSKPVYEQQTNERRKAAKGVRRDYQTLAEWLDDDTSAPLPAGWPLRTTRDYQTAVLRAWKLHYPDADWLNGNSRTAQALGVSARRIDAYLERAGVEVQGRQTDERRITSAQNIERQAVSIGYELKGRPLYFRVEATDGRETQYSYGTEAAAHVVNHLAAGAQVYVVCQVANKHHALEDVEPPAAPVRRTLPASEPKVEGAAQRPVREDVPKRATGYSPEWVRGQLVLRLHLLGWMHNGRFVNCETGECAPLSADIPTLLAFLTGREVMADPLLKTAEALGAVVHRMS